MSDKSSPLPEQPPIRERAVEFFLDVVMLDIGLPGMDGFYAARKIRRPG